MSNGQENSPKLNNKRHRLKKKKRNRDSETYRTVAKDPMIVLLQKESRTERLFNEIMAEMYVKL